MRRMALTAVAAILAVIASARSALAAKPMSLGDVTALKDEWFATPEAVVAIGNVISWQTPDGGWAKGYDAASAHRDGEPFGADWDGVATIDNNRTYTELRLLARHHSATKAAESLTAFNRGLDYLFKAQYPNGSWPQRFPLPKNYGREITFNDDAMINVMRLLEDIVGGKPEFAFVDPVRRKIAAERIERGVGCILKCQIETNGKLTAWAQQYDPETLKPAAARAYELPAITADESVNILLLLMRIEQPSDEVKRAIVAAVKWFDDSKITGKRIEKSPSKETSRGFDLALVDDPTAPPLWARFYDIETNQPFFVSHDGVKRFSIAEIDAERRTGYAWLNPWGDKIPKAYAQWLKKHGLAATAATRTITVAADGSGDFSTVQSAIDAVPSNNTQRVVIFIKPGTYHQKLEVPRDRPLITFLGNDAKTTVLAWHFNAKSKDDTGKEVGTSGSCSTLINGDDFVAENITFQNTAGDTGQAVALKFNSDRGVFRNCRFLGWQDTLYVHDRRVYFEDCYIEGRVDFIFGKSTAVFEHCTIHSKNGGYVTAAATTPAQRFGLVFVDCTLTGEGNTVHLGRPWRPDAAVAFIRCNLGGHIKPEGWHNWNKPDAEKTARFVEFENSGPGANPSARVPWSRQLSAAEVEAYATDNVLRGGDNWSPDRPRATSQPSTLPARN